MVILIDRLTPFTQWDRTYNIRMIQGSYQRPKHQLNPLYHGTSVKTTFQLPFTKRKSTQRICISWGDIDTEHFFEAMTVKHYYTPYYKQNDSTVYPPWSSTNKWQFDSAQLI